jgi:hypothetical protein
MDRRGGDENNDNDFLYFLFVCPPLSEVQMYKMVPTLPSHLLLPTPQDDKQVAPLKPGDTVLVASAPEARPAG